MLPGFQSTETIWFAALALLVSSCQGSTKTSDASTSAPPATAQPSVLPTVESPPASAERPRPITTNPSGPSKTNREPPALLVPPNDGVETCVAACVRARQMEAVGIEVIESTCRDRCRADPNAYAP